jgi:hypothetical protein
MNRIMLCCIATRIIGQIFYKFKTFYYNDGRLFRYYFVFLLLIYNPENPGT